MEFKITHPTGYLKLKILTFFRHSTRERIRKVFKLARKYCTNSLREQLLETLKKELEISFIYDKMECKRLRWCFSALTSEVWN